MTSTWQTPRTESTLDNDAVKSLEYRPIVLSEDMGGGVEAVREDEDFSKIDEDQHQVLVTPCQSGSGSRRIDEGLPFECPLLLIDDVSLRDTDGSVNSTSTKSVPIEGEKRCASEGNLVDSTLDGCNQLLAAEIEAVEGATQPQQELIDELPLLVDSDHSPKNIVELISDAMEGCYVNASNGQSCETVPSCPIEHECWDTRPINCDLVTEYVRSPETSCLPEGEEDKEDEDIVILTRESLHTEDDFPVCEDSELLLSNNDEHSITPPTLVYEQKENRPRAKDRPFSGSQENDRNQTSGKDFDSNALSYRDTCLLDEEEWNQSTPGGQQSTSQCDDEGEVEDNETDDVKGTCLDKMFRPVYTAAKNEPASHGTQFIESLAPPISYRHPPRTEARGYHSECRIEGPERDHTIYTSSSESTTSSTAFVEAMNLRNRQKSNIFESVNPIPMPPSKDGANDLGAVLFKSEEAKQDPSRKCHGDFMKEPLHSDEQTLSQMSEILPRSDSNRAGDVDLEGTSGRSVSPDPTDALVTHEITVHPLPDSGKNHTTEDRQIVGIRGLEDSKETNNEIIRPDDQSDGENQHSVRESNDLLINNCPGKHCVQITGSRKNASTVCNIPPQVKFGVLQTQTTTTSDVEEEVEGEGGQIAKERHQPHPPMSPRPFDQPGHLSRHDNNLTSRVGGARSSSPSRKVERLRRRELYRLTREVMLQKDRWERMHQDALRSVDEFNLVRQEVSRLYNRLDNNQNQLLR